MNEKDQQNSLKEEAIRRVSGPSVGLLVTAIIGGIFSFLNLLALMIGLGMHSNWFKHSRWIDDIPFEHAERFFQGSFAIGSSLVGLLIAGFIIFVSLKMKELEEWSLSVAASILAMIPCISPCCIIGLPIGIWSLVVLMDQDVKKAFMS